MRAAIWKAKFDRHLTEGFREPPSLGSVFVEFAKIFPKACEVDGRGHEAEPDA